jgi:YbbR domain-containing protein
VSPAGRHSTGWRRRVTAAFTQHLALKASAVLLAIVLWFAVAAREPMEEIASVRFAPQLDSALVLRDPPPIIRALVIGRANEILKLSTTPLVIRRSITSDAPDTLVLALRTSDIEVPEGVEVIVRDVQPRSLTLRFESTVTRMVPVRSAIIVRAPAGTTNVSVRLDPESVTVRGPRRTVARLRSIPTVRDSVTVDTLPHLVDLDTTGLGVSVRPPQVKALVRRART